MTQNTVETQPENSAAPYCRKNTEPENRTVQEPAACYTAAPSDSSPSVRVAVVPAASRLELALSDAKKYPERCTRWYDREELINKGALEIMLDEYHSVKLLAIALNCSEDHVFRALESRRLEA
ncbi:MAG: hypothetical protein Q4Q20_05410 [Methanocorpusculum sp.]|nr:hypothetical protein [Methanocorpusculum sp.]